MDPGRETLHATHGGEEELAALAPLPVSRRPGPGGREYRAYPSLARVRWLVPAGSRAARGASVNELFRPASLRGRLYKGALSAGIVPGERVYLEGEPLSRLEGEMARLLGGRDLLVAFYVGTPGAYRKVTAQAISPEGETLAFAKIASKAPARADVRAEQRNLRRLEEVLVLHGAVPRALSLFEWRRSAVLLMTPGPPAPGPSAPSHVHTEFLAKLFAAFATPAVFGESPLSLRTSGKLDRLRPGLPGPLAALMDRAFASLSEDLGPVTLPVSVAHRDFAPWNTRLGPRGLFVFDWDRAEWGVPPLYDLFHFAAIQAVLLRRKEDLPDRRLVHGLLDPLWPEGHRHLARLHLAYLLDAALFYAEARVVAPDAGKGDVLDWFARRLEARLRGDAFPG